MARHVVWVNEDLCMAYTSQTVPSVVTAESVATFEWRNLHFLVVTREPLFPDQVRTIERVLPKVASVGQFADVVGMVLGRFVRIRTERPSPDIRFEVGLYALARSSRPWR
jgi:hypothetical protein